MVDLDSNPTKLVEYCGNWQAIADDARSTDNF